MKTDITTIQAIKSLERVLPKRDFKENLRKQISKYEITEDFIVEFQEYIDAKDISAASLTPECIHLLMELGKFDYNIWSENLKFKNIDILEDDEFIIKYHVNTDDVIKSSMQITDTIFKKFFNNCSDEACRELVKHYNGQYMTIDDIASKISIFGADLFNLKLVKQDLQNTESKIKKTIMNSGKPIQFSMFLHLISGTHDTKMIDDNIDNLDFVPDEDTENIVAANRARLSMIVGSYPDETMSKILMHTFTNSRSTLMNATLLVNILCLCDNLTEECLLRLSEAYVLCGERETLATYAKNHNYENLFAVLYLS